MPNFKAVTKTDFGNLRWKRYDTYHFAGQDAITPLLAHELSKACLSLPIAFFKQNDTFTLVVLLGLQAGKNLFVSPDGRWIGPYIPAAYRGHPFALAQAENDQMVLCVDTDSGLIGEQYDQRFFDANGEPTQSIKDVLGFLQQVHHNRGLTERLCAVLGAEQLITPWPLVVKGETGEQTIEGLYRVDEARLNSLDSEALERVHKAGALPLVYCQLLSMQHIQTLGQLTEAHAKLKPASAVDLDSVFGGGGDSLEFTFD